MGTFGATALLGLSALPQTEPEGVCAWHFILHVLLMLVHSADPNAVCYKGEVKVVQCYFTCPSSRLIIVNFV